jgi:hypothetical protein
MVGYLLELLCDHLLQTPRKCWFQYQASRQMNLGWGSMPMMMNSMLQLMVGGWTSRSGYTEQDWWCGCIALQKYLDLSRHRLM